MDLRREFRKRLLRFEEVSFAFFFGSRPGGKARVDSDWDVAVYLSEDLSPRQRFEARLRINSELADLGQIDLVASVERWLHLAAECSLDLANHLSPTEAGRLRIATGNPFGSCSRKVFWTKN